jgi:hypothetical protein
MAKYMVLYNSKVKASDNMANSTPEEMQSSMAAWIKWKEEAEKTVKFDWGLPLQAVARVTSKGIDESDSQISGHSFMEGEKEEILELLKTHPHLDRPGASIDLLEMLSMPGV